MHDLTATQSTSSARAGVQRMRVLDFIPGTPFLTARALEIPEPARQLTQDRGAAAEKLRRLSIDLLIALARALVHDEELPGYSRRPAIFQFGSGGTAKALLTPLSDLLGSVTVNAHVEGWEMTAMATEIRKSGIDVVGDMVAWGAHFCLFYETKEDLLDTLISYCIVGFGKRGILPLDCCRAIDYRRGHRCAERRGA
jgi:hypothetical protein